MMIFKKAIPRRTFLRVMWASLALAMTEKHEKAERAAIMREQNCTELEAVYVMAERIARNRSSLAAQQAILENSANDRLAFPCH